MIVRKLFKYEMSHRVIGAYTKRCSQNNHGHSYKLELMFSNPVADAAGMAVDFSILKQYIGPFVDSFDHSVMMWTESPDVEINFFEEQNVRWITAPFSSTAEMQAAMFLKYSTIVVEYLKHVANLKKYISSTLMAEAAIVHETDTGYAKCFASDAAWLKDIDLSKIVFSTGIVKEWPVEFQAFYSSLRCNYLTS